MMLDHLRNVIGLRGYGQRDPLNEYKSEAFTLFEAMIQSLREAVTAQLMRVEIVQQPPPEQQPTSIPPGLSPSIPTSIPASLSPHLPTNLPPMQAHKIDPTTGEDEMALAMAGAETLARAGITGATAAAIQRDPANPTSWGKVGRNENCPCGSGKKYKHCHGRYG
jgi:preprotein translocase subunit SecA